MPAIKVDMPSAGLHIKPHSGENPGIQEDTAVLKALRNKWSVNIQDHLDVLRTKLS